MSEPQISQTEPYFTDELADEAIDQPHTPPSACCGAPGGKPLCQVFPSAPGRVDW